MNIERDIWKQKKVRLGKTSNEGGIRMNPDSSQWIYMAAVKEEECKVVAWNRRKNTMCARKTQRKCQLTKIFLLQKHADSFQWCNANIAKCPSPTYKSLIKGLLSLPSGASMVFIFIWGGGQIARPEVPGGSRKYLVAVEGPHCLVDFFCRGGVDKNM